MALSKSEIEILIKARNEAQGAFDSLSKQVSAVTGGATQATAGLEKVGKATKDAGSAGVGASVAFGMLAERLARGLVGAFSDTISAANKLDSGLIGLASVAKAFGQDAGQAQIEAKKLAADGLMSVGDAATSLKNLLAAGFGLPEAVVLMNRFKDSAAFGRQGSLDFGEAIRGATEGIKNGNSILVDNAGVTKNLSQMLTEAGFSAQDLSKASSDVNVRMAIYNGILKETNPQLGDTARFLEATAGKQAAFTAEVVTAQQKIGKELQPALASLLSTLQPMIQVVGNNADVFLSLSGILAAVVVPLAAVKGMAALGIPTLGSLTASALKMGQDFSTAAAASGTLRGGLAAVSTQAGWTFAGMGLLKTAALAAGAAFIGWEIGKIIDHFTGLSGAIEKATIKLMGWNDANQTAGAKQDSVTKAIANGAAATISYTDAIKFNEQIAAIRAATFDKSTAAQLRGIDAELALGRITLETANARKGAIAAEQQAQDVQGRRLKLTDAVINAEKAFQAEIKATGYSTAELVKSLKTNEAGFDLWAKQVKLSDETIKRLKDSMKAGEEQHKKSQKATEDHAKATEKLKDDLFALGVVSTDTGTKALKALIDPLTLAGTTSTPAFHAALVKILPQLTELAKMAAASGVQVNGLAGALERSKQAAQDQLAPMLAWENSLPTVPMEDLIGATRAWTAEQEIAGTQTRITADAFKYFGISTRKELQDTATEAERAYQAIVAAVGKNAPEAVTAYKAMIEAQKAATRELPSMWRSEIFPAIKNVIGTLTTAINGSFAQMLLGAKGFKDGFTDIWNSIKAAALNVLNSILSAFLNTFLKGMLGAMSGQQGAFGAAFSGLLSGGKGGGPGDWQGPLQGGGGIGGGALGGGAAAAGVGYGLGQFWQGKFGGAGWKAGGAGALSGAATGALIGSIVPGLGTLIGGVIGGLAGLVGGLLGKSVGEKANDIRDQFFAYFGGAGTGEGSGFATLAAQLTGISAEKGGGEGGGTLFKNLIDAKDGKDLEAAINAVVAALTEQEEAAKKAKEATDALAASEAEAAATSEAATKAAADKAAEEEAQRAAAAQKRAEELKAAQEAVRAEFEKTKAAIQSQIDAVTQEMAGLQDSIANEAPEAVIGVIEQQTRDRIDELAKQKDALQKHLGDVTEEEQTALDLLAKKAEEAGKQLGENLGKGIDGLPAKSQEVADDIADIFSRLKIQIPIEWILANLPTPTKPPGAAGGIMARQPGVVLFGEGGETEVGGPASFFKRVFESMGLDKLQGSGGGGGDLILTFNVTALSADGLRQTVEDEIVPIVVDSVQTNRHGQRTKLRTALGFGTS